MKKINLVVCCHHRTFSETQTWWSLFSFNRNSQWISLRFGEARAALRLPARLGPGDAAGQPEARRRAQDGQPGRRAAGPRLRHLRHAGGRAPRGRPGQGPGGATPRGLPLRHLPRLHLELWRMTSLILCRHALPLLSFLYFYGVKVGFS